MDRLPLSRTVSTLCLTAVLTMFSGMLYTQSEILYVVGPFGAVTLFVESSDTMENIKQKVTDVTGLPTDQQELIYLGEVLEDGFTVADYGLVPGNVLLLGSTSTDVCKKNGWRAMGIFKNQGACVNFIATDGRNHP